MLIVLRKDKKMDVYTVSLFGHREIGDIIRLEKKLFPMIKELLRSHAYISFLIGRNGEFDECAAAVIRRVRKEMGAENSELLLILPYKMAKMEEYEAYYDGIIIPDCLHEAHPKSAITGRNRWMVEQANLVLAYVEHQKGGAYTAVRYAQKKNKAVINLCENT